MDKAPGSDAVSSSSSAGGRVFVNIRRKHNQDLNKASYASALSKIKGGLNLEYTIEDSTDVARVLDVVVTEYAITADRVRRTDSSEKKREVSFLNGQVYEEKLYFEEGRKVYVGQKINDRIIIQYFNTEYNEKPYKTYICDMSMKVKQINSHGAYYNGEWNYYIIKIDDSVTPPKVTDILINGNGESRDYEIARGTRPIFPPGVGFEYLI